MNEQRERILVVEDDTAVREIVALSLRERGYEVETATSASAALDVLGRSDFALALVDIHMPGGKDGVWLLEKVRAGHPDTSVVMVTAVADVGTAVDCLRRGATDYLLKPVPADVLDLTVKRALRERSMKLELERYRNHLEEKVEEQAGRIRQLYMGSVESLAMSLEAKDAYTRGHSERVAFFAAHLAQHLGLPKEDVEDVGLAGRLHDIGKIGVRESVLNKPGKLTDDEFDHVKQHPSLGAKILEPIVENGRITEAVRHHHENWDGTGYPDGLARDHIPLFAQVLRVCDIYEALTSDRSYRAAHPRTEARAIMGEETGRTMCPDMASAFLTLLASGALEEE